MNRKYKRKKWLDARSRKLREKKHKHGCRKTKIYTEGKSYTAIPPRKFSFYNNHEETAEFFRAIIKEIKKQIRHENFYFDFREVSYVGIESIVYIIAILRNIKHNSYLHYEFQGNFPSDENAKRIFVNSGFLKYVEAKKMRIPKSSDNVQILTGNNVNTALAKTICDFAWHSNSINEDQKRVLYNILIELMSNTVQHAYGYKEENDTCLVPAWFAYCEYKNERLIFTFIDIGEGIPQTVHRKFLQDINLNDSKAILSALNGEYRSSTRKKYRGRGLPYLKRQVVEGMISSFSAMSGRGRCIYDCENKEFRRIDYRESVIGTVFYWEMGRSI